MKSRFRKIGWILSMSILTSSIGSVFGDYNQNMVYADGDLEVEELENSLEDNPVDDFEEEIENNNLKNESEIELGPIETEDLDKSEELLELEDISELDFYRVDLDEIIRELDDIEDELFNIEYLVQQTIRSRVANITSELNSINDWATKEPLMKRLQDIEDDINIKDQLGYIKGQIDAYISNPSESLKDRINKDIDSLREKIKNQGLNKHGEKNDFQLDILDKLLNGDGGGNTEAENNRIKEMLDSIEERLGKANSGLVPSSIRDNIKDVEELIKKLTDDNPNKDGFEKRLSDLEDDVVIKDALFQLESNINSFEKNPNNEALKASIERIIGLYEGKISEQDIKELKDNNSDRLNRLKDRFEKIKNGEKSKEITNLLKEVSEDLYNKFGEPAEIGTRQKLNRAEALIEKLIDDNKEKLSDYSKDLKFDIDLKDGLEELEGLVDDYDNSPNEGIKVKIDEKILVMEKEIKKQEDKGKNEYITEHIKHNKDKLNRLKKRYEEIKGKETEEVNKDIQDELDRIKLELEKLEGKHVETIIINDMENVLKLIDDLDKNNEKLPSFRTQYKYLEEDISIKNSLDEIDTLLKEISEKKSITEEVKVMDDVENKLSVIKSKVDVQYLTPHKTHNRYRARDLEKKSIDMRLDIVEKGLLDLKGEASTGEIKKEHGKINKMIAAYPGGKEIFGNRYKNLSDDIFIKDSLEQLSQALDQYLSGKHNINKIDIIHGIEYMEKAIDAESDDLKAHKQHNKDKLDKIKNKLKDYENETSDLIKRLLKEIEEELALQNGEPLIDSTGKKMDKAYNLIREMDESALKKQYASKFKELYEDAVIKNQLKILEDDVKKYEVNMDESLKKKIENEIELLEERIKDEELKPHKSHNKNKLDRLIKKYDNIVDTDINNRLSKIILDLKKLVGMPASKEIRKETEDVRTDISDLKDSDENKSSYIKKLSHIDEDISFKDGVEAISVRVEKYEKIRISEEAVKLEKDIEELKNKIEKEFLTPHKDHNISRLYELKNKLQGKTEPEYGEDITNLLNKVRVELEALKGDAPGPNTTIPDDFMKIEELISNVLEENRTKYLNEYKELRLDYNNKYRIKEVGDLLDEKIDDLNEETIREIRYMIATAKSLIDYQELEPHKTHNRDKLKAIEIELDGKIIEKENSEIYNKLKDIEKELFDKNGEKAEKEIKNKLDLVLQEINKLGSNNKDKKFLEEYGSSLSLDIRNKDGLDELSKDIHSFKESGELKPDEKAKLIKEFEDLYISIGQQTLLSHRKHNMSKLGKLLGEYQGIIKDKETENISDLIERTLKEIEEELKLKKGNMADPITRLKEGRVKLLIEQLDINKQPNKTQYEKKYLDLFNDTSIKDDIDLANKFVESYNRTWSDADKESMRAFIRSIEERIKSQTLVPHKVDNLAKLKSLAKDFEEKIDKENSEIRDLLTKIEKDLRLQEGNKARQETIDDLNRVNGLITSLSSENKSEYLEKYKVLEEDKNIKDEIYNVNKDVASYPDKIKDKDAIEKEIEDLYEKIEKQTLTPHKTHNKNKLDGIKYSFENKVEEKEEGIKKAKVQELLDKIIEDLAKLNGAKATEDINKEILEVKGLIDGLKKPAEFEEKYNSIIEDRDIKDEVAKINDRVADFKNNLGDKDKLKEDIKDLLSKIEAEKLEPHKEHNKGKLENLSEDLDKQIEEKEEGIKKAKVQELLDKIIEDLAKLNGAKATEDINKEILEVKGLIDGLKKPAEFEEKYNNIIEDRDIKDEVAKINDRVANFKNNLGDKDKLKEDIKDLLSKIEAEKLEPHKNHNKAKLEKIKKDLDDKIQATEDNEIEILLNKIEKELSDLNGEKSPDSIKNQLKHTEELIEKLSEADINKGKYKEKDSLLSKDIEIKDKLSNLKEKIEKLSKDISKEKREKIEKEISQLRKEIEEEKLSPHKDHNLAKLSKLEKLLKDKTQSKPTTPGGSGGGGGGGGGSSPTDPDDKDKEKEIEKEIEEIEKEIEKNDKDEEDKKDKEEIEKEINEVEDKVKELEDGKAKDDLVNKLDELKDRLDKLDIPDNIISTDNEVHKGYLTGYDDNTIRPKNNTTREEVATVIFRVSDKEKIEKYITKENSFRDIDSGHWSEEFIGTLANAGVINGYEDGSFKPKKSLTRAELAKMIVQANGIKKSKDTKFDDIKGHWAEEYINALASKGWIKGYGDNTFRPDKKVTRAELSIMINNMLGRDRTSEVEIQDIPEFEDLNKDAWYYDDILEGIKDHRP